MSLMQIPNNGNDWLPLKKGFGAKRLEHLSGACNIP